MSERQLTELLISILRHVGGELTLTAQDRAWISGVVKTYRVEWDPVADDGSQRVRLVTT